MTFRNVIFVGVAAMIVVVLVSCGGGDPLNQWLGSCTPPQEQRDQVSGRIGNIRYEITGVRSGLANTSELDLDRPEAGREWLIILLTVSNQGDDEENFSSDYFRVDTGKELVNEDGGASGGLNERLKTKDMGDWRGTSIKEGKEQVFALPYKVPTDGMYYKFGISRDGKLDLSLHAAIMHCPSSDIQERVLELERLQSTPFVCVDAMPVTSVQDSDGSLWTIEAVQLIDSEWEVGVPPSMDEDETWILVTFQVQNQVPDSRDLDSDQVKLRVDGEVLDEDGAGSGDVNQLLGTNDMGNIVGTILEPGFSVRFSMAFVVDYEPIKMDLIIDRNEEHVVPLDKFLNACNPVLASTVVSTPVADPLPMPTPQPTPTVAAQPTSVPKPTATSGTSGVPAGTDRQTIAIVNNPETYHNTRITIRGEVYTIDKVDDQTVFVLTDGQTYLFTIVYDGDLPNVKSGDTVIVTGILLEQTVQGTPLVKASTVREP